MSPKSDSVSDSDHYNCRFGLYLSRISYKKTIKRSHDSLLGWYKLIDVSENLPTSITLPTVLKMEAVSTFETPVNICYRTRCHENMKSEQTDIISDWF